jgi:hypothetical protein
MSRDKPLWGTERIRGELLKLGVVVSNRSIRRYRWRGTTTSIAIIARNAGKERSSPAWVRLQT